MSEEYNFIVHLQTTKRRSKYQKSTLKVTSQNQKSLVLVGDLNLNSFDYTTNSHIRNFLLILPLKIVFFLWKLTQKNYQNKCKCNWWHSYKIYVRFWSGIQSGIMKNYIREHFRIFYVLYKTLESAYEHWTLEFNNLNFNF